MEIKQSYFLDFIFFYLDAPNAVHVKYNCLVSNGIKKGHLLVSCSHQSGKAPLASAKGSCSLMQGIKHVWNNSKIKNGKKPITSNSQGKEDNNRVLKTVLHIYTAYNV